MLPLFIDPLRLPDFVDILLRRSFNNAIHWASIPASILWHAAHSRYWSQFEVSKRLTYGTVTPRGETIVKARSSLSDSPMITRKYILHQKNSSGKFLANTEQKRFIKGIFLWLKESKPTHWRLFLMAHDLQLSKLLLVFLLNDSAGVLGMDNNKYIQ